MPFLLLACLTGLLTVKPLTAAPLGTQARARLAAGTPARVIVEFDYQPPPASTPLQRAAAFLAYKRVIEPALVGAGAFKVRDLTHMPLAVWRVDSLEMLRRLEALPGIRHVHEDGTAHAVSTSDLGFIHQPQAQAAGGTGAGTTIAVIDGGLGNYYKTIDEFGPCTDVGAPASCRVVYNADFYADNASAEIVHGTNVAGIALDTAPQARLAMFNVFNGAAASFSDILTAMDGAVQLQPLYNVVAINLSLGDGSSSATPCTASPFVTAVQNANAAGISVIAAAGNSGSKSGLGLPACTPGVIAVGAVYDQSYGTLGWSATAVAGGSCSDASAADKVTCFSQSASYLALLAPGTFVISPDASFVESGTSQATPHVAGAVAVLRARYPAESLAGTLLRLQSSGPVIPDGNGVSAHRLDLGAAFLLGTAVSLSGTGTSAAIAGTSSTFSVTVRNQGPLAATHVVLTDTFPAVAQITSLPAGCSRNVNAVTCTLASLAAGASSTFSVGVQWTASTAVYDAWRVSVDQVNSAPVERQVLQFGIAPPALAVDGPLPAWSVALLGLLMLTFASRGRQRTKAQTML